MNECQDRERRCKERLREEVSNVITEFEMDRE